ncbi:hypothetical protein B0H67DRAFT_548571 [Lasiosphaeris hirsuta]|uniref:Uncharacterized protein n=1 Tax=Lasiosphaeris hirsuta TaxID=260670 RepID=A0AA40BAP9_9PEZI|nr:hypothetical protein B0H67DRAFT_548571 [Lasiosphaeris hirsuta]
MGALCSKEGADDPFAQPGRRLGDAPPPAPTTAAVPASATSKRTVGGPPRILGGGNNATSSSADAAEARRMAAAAAEARSKSTKSGDLGKKLAGQKKLSHRATLQEASREAPRVQMTVLVFGLMGLAFLSGDGDAKIVAGLALHLPV